MNGNSLLARSICAMLAVGDPAAPISGRIVGHDFGKDPAKQLERNSLCPCGSGRKAKRCCRDLRTAARAFQPMPFALLEF